jgi:hypothetical protein
MGCVPVFLLPHLPSEDNRKGIRARSEQPPIEETKLEVERVFHFAHWDTLKFAYLTTWLRMLAPIFEHVYCPTESVRHIESAKVWREVLGLKEIKCDHRLNGIDYGAFKGKVAKLEPPALEFIDQPYPGGESYWEVIERTRSFCEEELKNHDREPALIVSSAGSTRRAFAHLCNGVPLEEAVMFSARDFRELSWLFFYRF